MSNDIDQHTEELIAYLSVLEFPSTEILVEKILLPFQKVELSEITLKSNSGKNLSIEDKGGSVITLNKDDLEKYGLSIADVKTVIEDIKNKDSEKLFFQAIEEIINLHFKNLCKIYIPKAILAYTKFCEKLKPQNPEPISEIYKLVDLKINSSSSNKKTETLEYNYFKRAYQGYEISTGFAYIFGLETENLKIIFNITKELKKNFIPYQTAYITLINLIEELYTHTENKTAPKSLIDNLKFHIDICFSSLIQTPPDKKIAFAKNTIENLISTTQELIKNYIEDHPDECKIQRSILYRLLWFITKLIPSSILAEDRRMALFGNYTENGTQIKKLSDQVKVCSKSCLTELKILMRNKPT